MNRFCVFVSFVILNVLADDLADYKEQVATTNKYIKLAGETMHTIIIKYIEENEPMEIMSLLFAAPDMEIKENELQQRIGYETKLQSEILEILKINYTDIEQKTVLCNLLKKIFVKRSCEFPALGNARRDITLEAVKIAILKYAVPPFLSTKTIEMPSSETIPEIEMLKRFNRMCRLKGLRSSIEKPTFFIKQAVVKDEGDTCWLTDCNNAFVCFSWMGIAYH
ncbi:uncharacterized protein LOC126841368 [Adelges cooleyi]|uniref:uncharacterized protein LOC126841368 n=1 Tax=Adelges cooleyi TaxID=133065 RepID=UPI00217F68E8|nr:uncharacterized protein LOC126841368 [Adelges cooleyi]